MVLDRLYLYHEFEVAEDIFTSIADCDFSYTCKI